MKNVFSTSELPHIWASQSQQSGRAGAFHFHGDTIYSYGSHFPIAKIIGGTVLFTTRGYSNSTAKRIQKTRNAVNHLPTIFCPHPTEIQANFDTRLTEAKHAAAKLIGARKPQIYLDRLAGISDQVNKFVAFHYLHGNSIETPVMLSAALSIQDRADYVKFNAESEILKAMQAKQAKKQAAADHKKALAKWIKGEGSSLYARNGFDYLRVNGDLVQTSQGVNMTIPQAVGLYNAIANNLLAVGAVVLGRYTVSSVGKNITIGCHNFKASYLLSFGKKLIS